MTALRPEQIKLGMKLRVIGETGYGHTEVGQVVEVGWHKLSSGEYAEMFPNTVKDRMLHTTRSTYWMPISAFAPAKKIIIKVKGDHDESQPANS